jgi:hypothetical protein
MLLLIVLDTDIDLETLIVGVELTVSDMVILGLTEIVFVILVVTVFVGVTVLVFVGLGDGNISAHPSSVLLYVEAFCPNSLAALIAT